MGPICGGCVAGASSCCDDIEGEDFSCAPTKCTACSRVSYEH